MAQSPKPLADLPAAIGQAVYDKLLASGADARVIVTALQAIDVAVREYIGAIPAPAPTTAPTPSAPAKPAKSAPPAPGLPRSANPPTTPPPGVDTAAGKTTTA